MRPAADAARTTTTEAEMSETAMLRTDEATHKWVLNFGGGSAEGRAEMRNLLGGKGAKVSFGSWRGTKPRLRRCGWSKAG